MADFGFVGASYEAPSIYQDMQECINWYPEVDPTKPQGSRGVIALYPTPGLTSIVALSAQAEVRGMRTLSGGNYMVVVCGAYVYVLNSTFTPTIVGQLNSSSGRVGITDNALSFEREKRLKIQYIGKYLKKEHTPDFVCCGKIVLELKAARELTEIHQAQLFNYLKASKFRMGLLFNFGETSLQFKRFIL